MLNVIDTGSSQWNLDFPTAFGEGFRDCYVKMGGDNTDVYVAPWYARQVDRCRSAGFGHVGHYWVPDANPADSDAIDTPTQQADWMADRLHDWRKGTDFIVLDNEALDGAWMFTDAGAAEFIERMKARKGIPGRQVAMYGGWYDLAAHPWPAVLATGAVFIVADYRTSSQPPFNFPDIPTIPRDRIIGHQYGGRAIGGVITDTNVFVDHAFEYAPTPKREDDIMFRLIPIDDVNETRLQSGVTGRSVVVKPDHLPVIERFLNNDGTDRMLSIESDIVGGYLAAVAPTVGAGSVDTDAVAAKVIAGIRPDLEGVVSAEDIDRVLADNFAAIPKAVNDDAARRAAD